MESDEEICELVWDRAVTAQQGRVVPCTYSSLAQEGSRAALASSCELRSKVKRGTTLCCCLFYSKLGQGRHSFLHCNPICAGNMPSFEFSITVFSFIRGITF